MSETYICNDCGRAIELPEKEKQNYVFGVTDCLCSCDDEEEVHLIYRVSK